MRWGFLAAVKNMKENNKFDKEAAQLIDKILNVNS